jgi:holo-[acyl-carrier protein] synthase
MSQIAGTGIDVIEVDRIERALTRPATGERFRARVFTVGEVEYCESRGRPRYQSYAARFAAKEAGAKALGTGIQHGVAWKELEVRRQPGARPTLHFSGRAGQIAERLGVRHTALSLTHSTTVAMAAVHLED